MATANIIVAAGSSLANPPTNEATVFINTENNNILSIKYSDGTIQVYTNVDGNFEDCCACDIAKKFSKDLSCALENGAITAAEYTALVNIGLTVSAVKTSDIGGNGAYTVNIGPLAGNIPPVSLIIIPNVTAKTNPSTQQYYVQFTPLNTSNQAVVWVSSNLAAGTIDQNGLFTTVAPGTTIIYAYSVANGTIFGTKTIVVS